MSALTDADKNRDFWDQTSDGYQQRHGPQLNRFHGSWGMWDAPEANLRVLGGVVGKEVLELGCGAAQWSIFLARQGARPVGLDNSARQLEHARRLMAQSGVALPLVQAAGEQVPFADDSFDVVFCDHGAMSFADPERTVPEAARVLRPGGLLAFNLLSPLVICCWNAESDQIEPVLHVDYFDRRRFEFEGAVEYHLTYGEWIRLLRQHGLILEDLIELQPPEENRTTYDSVPHAWARRWPSENIWKARKARPT